MQAFPMDTTDTRVPDPAPSARMRQMADEAQRKILGSLMFNQASNLFGLLSPNHALPFVATFLMIFVSLSGIYIGLAWAGKNLSLLL